MDTTTVVPGAGEESGYLFASGRRFSYASAMLGMTLTSFTIGMLGTSLLRIVSDLGGFQYLS